MPTARSFDFVVAGAGIIGTNVAAVLRERCPRASIAILDKEASIGLHASGRNSGVIHAGMYYAPGSAKANTTWEGNRFLTDYITRKGIPLRRCGKLIVSKGEEDIQTLEQLFARAAANGVPVEELSSEQANRIEPLAKTHRLALWSPGTSVSDPLAVLKAQLEDVSKANVHVILGAPVAKVERRGFGVVVSTPTGQIEAGHFINAAGLYADRFAHDLGFAHEFALLPFKGLYMYCKLPVRTLVYPVPDIGKPFLGVHFTCTVDGKVKVGPTAIPAFWREHYGGPDGSTSGFSLREAVQILGLEASMFLRQPDFRALALQEVRKYARSWMVRGASELIEGATPDAFTHYGRAGIRAQLVRWVPATSRHELVMDFEVQGDAHSTHVLNAVSPGWTSSRPFANLVADRILSH